MGAILNTLPLNETDNLAKLSPNRADWLTSYADATGLAVVEVERLWNRFRQITGSNDQTRIYPDGASAPRDFSSDVFAKNFLKQFPRSSADGDTIPFGYFIVVMQFFDSSTVEKKLGAIFFYLNNGEPITSVMISKLLKHVYPEAKDDEMKALSTQFMKQLGSTEKGKINQQQFIAGVQRFIPPDELDELLHFDIIPSYILEEANRLPSLQVSATNLRHTNDHGYSEQISDNQLKHIANQASRKNWTKFALNLGFLEYDIESYKVQNNNDPTATIYELLRTWRDQEGSLATKDRLRNCLRQSGLDELTSSLQ